MRITVYGVPAPQGSKRHVGNGIMIESSKNLGAWRRRVSAEAQRWLEQNDAPAPIDGPVELHATFYLPRPKSASKRIVFPATRPDVSKLLRAIEDSLSKIAYADDARIVDVHVRKRYAINTPPRVEIFVRELAADEAAA